MIHFYITSLNNPQKPFFSQTNNHATEQQTNNSYFCEQKNF